MNAADTFDKISLLRLSFQGLEEDELQKMAALSRFSTYPAGHVLCREGAYEDIMYIVAEGHVIISQKMSEEESERVLRIGGRGDLVGEMALIQNAPRSATVRTTTACTMLEMEKKDFETILRRSPRMANDIIRITLDRIRENDRTAIAELQKTNKLLRHLDRNKLEFIQVAAHELRTPVTVLKGYANVLGSFPEIKANAALGEVLAGINKGADRMHEVVNMMLDVSRMDTETLEIATVPVPVKRVIDDLARDFEKAAAERRIEIVTQHAEDTPNIHADPAMIQKALYHLIVNAIKYTPDGGKVTLSTRPVVTEDDVPGVEVAVRDTGIGLDPEHHELVFEKFYQVGSVAIHSSGKTTFKGGGPGLGLAIVRGVARAHGGKVWVESKGHDEVNFPGSTFYLRLPLTPQGNADSLQGKEPPESA
jgi:signal transduction histidine kinase